MSLLDRLAAWLNRREVKALRQQVVDQEQIIAEQKRALRIQLDQIGNANLRVSRLTNELLDVKRQMRNESTGEQP